MRAKCENKREEKRWRLYRTLTDSRISSGWTPGNFNTRSMNVGSDTYCDAFSADLLKIPSKLSRAHCNVCSIAFGKFFNVQIGMLFSGGSCVALYDSVTNGTTTYKRNYLFILFSLVERPESANRIHTHLYIAHCSHGTRINEHATIVNTTTIHVDASVHVV